MRQQHLGKPREILRLMFLEPQNLGGGEAGEHGVAERLERFLCAAQFLRDFLALRGGGGVAPELGRANDFAVLVQRNEAVLLSTHANGLDVGGTGFSATQRLPHRRRRRVAPRMGVLFFRARREIGDEVIRLRTGTEHLAGARVDDEDFGRLGAAIDADDESFHG